MKLISDSGNRYGSVYVVRQWECSEGETKCPDCSNELKISSSILCTLRDYGPNVEWRPGWQDVRCETCDLEGQFEVRVRTKDNGIEGNPTLQLSNLHRREREHREHEERRRAAKKAEKVERKAEEKIQNLNSKERRKLARASKT